MTMHYTLTFESVDGDGNDSVLNTEHHSDLFAATDAVVEVTEALGMTGDHSPEMIRTLNRTVTDLLGACYRTVLTPGMHHQGVAMVPEEGCIKITVRREQDVELALQEA